jgi:hypothetical protein
MIGMASHSMAAFDRLNAALLRSHRPVRRKDFLDE